MKTIFRIGCLSLMLMISSNLFAQQLSGDTYANALEAKKAKIVAVYLEEDAFAYKDANGNVTGLEIDIFNHFANWLKNAKGIELEIEFIGEKTFATFYTMVQNSSNGVFGLGTVTILDRRKSEIQFSPAFINNIAILATNNTVPTLSSLSALGTEFSSLNGLAAKGTTLEGYLMDVTKNYAPSTKLEYLPSQSEVAEKLAVDSKYFGYMDLSTFWPAVSKQKLPIKRHPAGDLSTETFGFIMPLNSDWEPVMKEFFSLGSGYRSTGMYRSTLMKHLGAEVTKMLELARTGSQN